MSLGDPATMLHTAMLSAAQIRRALSVRDLTDPAQGPHAIQLLVDAIAARLAAAWACEPRIHRGSPLVTVADNYDRLHYRADAVARDARYTRYVGDGVVLRTQTTATVPPLLRELGAGADALLVCPGLVYRRDAIDRLHTGEPHQLDLWRVRDDAAAPLGEQELTAMIAHVLDAALPGAEWRTEPAAHPYTVQGRELLARRGAGPWVEVGECGLALPALLAESGRPAGATGLAMGLGLDRLVMLRKGVDDIRLLRASDPRVAAQMLDLAPYRPVSSMPAVRRDVSLVLDAPPENEPLGDRVREALGDDAALVEEVRVLAVTPHDALQPAARARLGIAPGQHNVLVRVVLRALDRTLTRAQCDVLRDRVYAALHRAPLHEWAAAPLARPGSVPPAPRGAT